MKEGELLLNKLEIVEKGDFYHNVIALTTEMFLKGIFKNTFLLHIYVKNVAFLYHSQMRREKQERRIARDILKTGGGVL